MDKGLESKMLERAPNKSFLIQRIASWSIDAEPAKNCWHYDAWCQHRRNDKVRNL